MEKITDVEKRTSAGVLRESLSFALRFTYMRLEEMRRSEWAKLKEDIVRFSAVGTPGPRMERLRLGATIFHVSATDVHSLQQLSDQYIKELQKDTKRLIAPESNVPPRPPWRGFAFNPEEQIEVGLRCVPLVLGLGIPRFLGFSGTLRNLFLIRLLILLLQMPTDQIRRCLACDEVFVRNRKQRYCSKKCTDRVSKRNERDKKKTYLACCGDSRDFDEKP